MACLIAFDTSGPHVTAAVAHNDTFLAHSHEEMARGQAERLMDALNETLAVAQVTWRDLDALAVGVGPGNFTGIRISVAAARGLALGLGIPVIGVSTFEACVPLQADGKFALPGPRNSFYVQAFAQGSPIAAPEHLMAEKAESATSLRPEAQKFAASIATCAAHKLALGELSPAKPLYVKAPDAAPGRAAPKILS